MTEGEVAASSVAASGARASAASAAAPATAADAPKPSVMATHITAMEPGMELKLNAFMQWAGPIMLAALGEAPSEDDWRAGHTREGGGSCRCCKGSMGFRVYATGGVDLAGGALGKAPSEGDGRCMGGRTEHREHVG